jgi:hypothetical protein
MDARRSRLRDTLRDGRALLPLQPQLLPRTGPCAWTAHPYII